MTNGMSLVFFFFFGNVGLSRCCDSLSIVHRCTGKNKTKITGEFLAANGRRAQSNTVMCMDFICFSQNEQGYDRRGIAEHSVFFFFLQRNTVSGNSGVLCCVCVSAMRMPKRLLTKQINPALGSKFDF